MFKVKEKVFGAIYTVYAVKTVYKTTMFLIFSLCGDTWHWDNANKFIPID
jgi:hypothetical protein